MTIHLRNRRLSLQDVLSCRIIRRLVLSVKRRQDVSDRPVEQYLFPAFLLHSLVSRLASRHCYTVCSSVQGAAVSAERAEPT